MFHICQTDYCIHSKLRISPLFWSHTWKYNIQTNKRLAKVKEKWSTTQSDVFGLPLAFFIPMSKAVSKCCKQKWCMLFFTCIKLVVCVLVCAHAITHIKWRRLREVIKIQHGKVLKKTSITGRSWSLENLSPMQN